MEKHAAGEWRDGAPPAPGVYRVRPPISQFRRFSSTPFYSYWNGCVWSPIRKSVEAARDPLTLAQAAMVQSKQWRME